MTDLRSFALNRDAVCVTGPDAVSYLQGQLSQDVAGLDAGASAWSWLLQPAGKVDALVRVTRTGPEALLVDVDAGYGDAVLNRLNRFKLRTKAELTLDAIGVLAVRGPGARDVAVTRAAALGPLHVHWVGQYRATVVEALWPSQEEAADVLVEGSSGPGATETVAVAAALDPAGGDATAWESARIVAGVPVMGAELTEKTIPAETGLVAMTASFTKGCYTGQELVARIDSRGGNVPRHLRRLRAATPLAPGDELTNAEGKIVGTVTSAGTDPGLGPVGLGYVGRAVAPGDAVRAPSGPITVLEPDAV
jgi:folate-binding protein YgfZ